MKRASLFSSLALMASMVMAACLGGTDLEPSSSGVVTGSGGSTTGTGGSTSGTTSATTSSTGAAGGSTTGMGGSAGGTTSSTSTSSTSTSSTTSSSTTTTSTSSSTSTSTTTSTTSSTGTGGGVPVGDPPCDVLAFFERKCWNCHGTTPHSETGLALVTYQDLTAPSDEDPALTNAERSMITMQDPLDPMPPGVSPWATPEELAALQAWIDAGYPPADCGDAAKDPFAAQPTCTSGVIIDPNGSEGEDMTPGWACNACHAQQNAEQGADAPIYYFAGTIYPTAHEPDNCAGTSAEGAEIEVIDSTGNIHIAVANKVGNFMFEDPEHPFVYPYRVRVVFQGRERWMDTPETDADCNRCHNSAGIEDAPGRILLP